MSNTIKDIIKKPSLLFMTFGHRGCFNWMSDEQYLKIAYRIKMGKRLNLENPQTFNEKLQWLKLYDRRPEYTMMVDKHEVKEYVASIIGEEYITPTLGVWDKFEDIDFDKLPNQFVLKCTHDSGGLIICKDKSKLDKDKVRKKLNNCLKHNFFWCQREWPYKNVKPRIIAEKYMVDESGKELKDYKFFCFGGQPKIFKIDYNRYIEHHANYYTMEGDLLPFDEMVCPRDLSAIIEMPENLEQMIEIATVLSKEIPFVRVDLYNINGKIFFGEMTFYPATGMGAFKPQEWDYTLGSWIKLSPKK